MGRKPNYKFERLERERKKANKKAAKLEAKREVKDDAGDLPGPPGGDADEAAPDTNTVNAGRDGPTGN